MQNMTRLIRVFFLILPLLFAGEKKTSPKAGSSPAKASPPAKGSSPAKGPSSAKAPPAAANSSPAAPTIPADAKQIGPHAWRYTDPQGTTWILRETPFGIMKTGDRVEKAPADSLITVIEEGDTLRFTRPGPFGKGFSWTRKKTELNETEQKAWEREQQKRSSQPANQE